MRYTDIYVKADISLEKLAELVHRATGADMESFEDDGPVFVGLVGNRRISVQENPWYGDDESDIGSFALDIDVDGRNDDERIGIARSIFDALKKLKVGDLLLWDERDEELDRFTLTAGAP